MIADIIFLIENGANPNLNSKIHEMPLLHKACILGNPNLVRVLLSNGADVNKKVNKWMKLQLSQCCTL